MGPQECFGGKPEILFWGGLSLCAGQGGRRRERNKRQEALGKEGEDTSCPLPLIAEGGLGGRVRVGAFNRWDVSHLESSWKGKKVVTTCCCKRFTVRQTHRQTHRQEDREANGETGRSFPVF